MSPTRMSPTLRDLAAAPTVGAMLAITENAAEAIRELMTAAELPAGAGLRIVASEQQDTLEVQIAAEPGQEDTVVSDAGANVFLAPAAAHVLDDKVLDIQQAAATEGQAGVRFAVTEQDERTA